MNYFLASEMNDEIRRHVDERALRFDTQDFDVNNLSPYR